MGLSDRLVAGQIALTSRLRQLSESASSYHAQIVLIVAIAVVLVAGVVSYAVVASMCVAHGYNNVLASGPNGWKVWEFRIVCSK
jgi:hypothetical protein